MERIGHGPDLWLQAKAIPMRSVRTIVQRSGLVFFEHCGRNGMEIVIFRGGFGYSADGFLHLDLAPSEVRGHGRDCSRPRCQGGISECASETSDAAISEEG
ncbi:MAG TPA: hypothetical protein VMD29_00910 [Terracidiphilus sp.]|nr:hypothetical protein [Terracidiphilus sp.]